MADMEIVCPGCGGSVYAAISAEAGAKHGTNPPVVIYDELAESKNQQLFNAQTEPLFFTISAPREAAPQSAGQLDKVGTLFFVDTVFHLFG